jgi:hypothetical protein
MRVLADYLAAPVPLLTRMGTFSAYKFPGLLVHAPVMLAFLGLASAAPPTMLGWTLRAALAVSGLYWGRDLAVLCHYFILLAPVVVIGLLMGTPPLVKALPQPLPVGFQAAALAFLGLAWGFRLALLLRRRP